MDISLPTPIARDLALRGDEDLHEKFLAVISRLTGGPVLATTTPEEIREKIAIIEAKTKLAVDRGEVAAQEFPLTHDFTGDSYVRSVGIEAGSFIVGKLHKHQHVNFISIGKVSVLTEFGHELIVAPRVLISPAGTKRILLVHEDMVWTGIHVTPERDLAAIEEQVIAKSYSQIGLPDPVVDLKKLEGD